MSDTDNSTAAVFNAFIEASQALKDLPKVRADLDAAQALASETESKLNTERDHSNNLQATLDNVRANLAAKEAELAQATFRSNTLQTVVDTIRGALPSMPVAASSHDRPSDMPDTVVASEASSTQAPAQSDMDPTTTGSHQQTENQPYTQHSKNNTSQHGTLSNPSVEGQPVTDPKREEPHAWPNPPHNPSAASTVFPWQTANTPPASPHDTAPPSSPSDSTTQHTPTMNPTSLPVTPPQATHSSEGRDHSGEDVSFTHTGVSAIHAITAGDAADTTGQASHDTNSTQTYAGGKDNTRPYEGRPYYDKPSGMSWREYRNLGGHAPSWYELPGSAD